MEFFDVVKRRQSIRAYAARPVEPEVLEQILEAANRAPSAGNLQAYEIYLACDAPQKAALAQAAGYQEFVAQAPVVLVFCAHGARSAVRYATRGRELYAVQDAAIACTFTLLAVTALGLGSVWIGAFDEAQVRQVIGAPATQRPVALLPIGYPAESPRSTPRRELRGLVHMVRQESRAAT